jgi:hypothetical protein
MRRFSILTASTVALAIAGAGVAAAQDKAAPARPLTPTSPGAGAIMKDESLKTDSGMTEHRTTVPVPDSSRAADTAGSRSYLDSKAGQSGASIAGGLSAEALIGADVLNASGEEIGEVQDLVIGSDNTVDKAIVEVGGFLGVGSKFVAVEIAQLKPDGRKKGFVTAMTEEELKSRAQYEKKAGSWVQRYN